MTFGNADGMSPSAQVFYSKSPTGTGNGGFPTQAGDNTARLTLFKQGIDILLSHLREQLDGHRWEIARESFEILQGTTNPRGDYQ